MLVLQNTVGNDFSISFTGELPADSYLQPFRAYYTQAELSLHALLQIRSIFTFTFSVHLQYSLLKIIITRRVRKYQIFSAVTCYKSLGSCLSHAVRLLLKWTRNNYFMGLWYVFLSGESGMRLWFQRVILTVLLFLRAGFCLTPPQTRPGPLLCTPLTPSETPSESQFVMSASACCPKLNY